MLTPLSTLYNSLILKGLKFNNFLAKNCKPSIYRALEKRVESQVKKPLDKKFFYEREGARCPVYRLYLFLSCPPRAWLVLTDQ